jgi:hypothetical protein
MKKLLFAALLTASLATSAFAKETNEVSYRVQNNFKSQFNQAQKVNWSVRSNFTKATFEDAGQKVEAFYDVNGNMIGTSRNITLNELPTGAKRTFAKSYGGYTVKEAIRFEGAEEDAYYISAENEKENVILKVTNDRYVSVFRTSRKK